MVSPAGEESGATAPGTCYGDGHFTAFQRAGRQRSNRRDFDTMDGYILVLYPSSAGSIMFGSAKLATRSDPFGLGTTHH